MEAFSLVKFYPPVRVEDNSTKITFKKGQAPVTTDDRKETTNDVKDLLNTILPPREFEYDGELWIQNVSSISTNR